ncbi:hypothetical protein BU25DRAFT_163791 [Macroventuria anomochaeta]|uniref:Uncharacterized protein n=1 Tax=Macroventuria anomochaeta TaxID=301207 RepID=A0ACB6RSG7_9PLEO|nr:uncharacterized protein BU25DRAFT_163791 [Macroventuria anomochaeta]KAF2624222.1 hypothetical protein BU25DRAFT_163791 [Macroventuria anomochaeta]
MGYRGEVPRRGHGRVLTLLAVDLPSCDGAHYALPRQGCPCRITWRAFCLSLSRKSRLVGYCCLDIKSFDSCKEYGHSFNRELWCLGALLSAPSALVRLTLRLGPRHFVSQLLSTCSNSFTVPSILC